MIEDYGPDIEYIQGTTNIVADALSRFSIIWNQETTHKSTYKKEIMSEINNIEEFTESIFPINLKIVDQYQQKEPRLKAKYNIGMYQKGSVVGEVIHILNL